jgi:protein-tyrosine-phosphatase
MVNVLMVCTGNICRSPMAEGLLKWMLPESSVDGVLVSSAGTHALVGNLAEQNAIYTMEQKGIDLLNHRARGVNGEMIKSADMVLVMEEMHIEMIEQMTSETSNIHLLSAYSPDNSLHEIFDPYGMGRREYDQCAGLIEVCLSEVIPLLENI